MTKYQQTINEEKETEKPDEVKEPEKKIIENVTKEEEEKPKEEQKPTTEESQRK